MEQKRLLLAITLSFAVFLVWSIVFGPRTTKPPVDTAQEQGTTESEGSNTTPTPEPVQKAEVQAPEPTAVAPEQTPQVKREARTITVDTPLYRMTFTEKGAAVAQVVLKDYRETVDADSPYKQLIPEGLTSGTVLLSMSDPRAAGLDSAIFSADSQADTIEVDRDTKTLTFTYVTRGNVTIEKIFRFTPDSYFVDLDVDIANNGTDALGGDLKLGLRDLVEEGKGTYGFEGPSGLINDSLEQIKIKKIEDNNKLPGTVRWVAIEKLYFMDSIVSKNPVEGYMALQQEDNIIENQLVTPLEAIPGGANNLYAFSMFMGPKSLKILKAANNDLDRAINFGWFDFIAKPCLWFMNWIYRFIPNYGIAIIILTIVTRLLFWPLATKSYKSMGEMRKLQPLMQELREKYKDDKVRMNQETMALYRTYKINPLGGCLPMLIQMPVFLALYRMLYASIELRHAPFFGWIQDLSAPDRLFHFDISLPFIQPPIGIPVLTLIMGATMILQQKMSPAPGDPAQAKMMMLMPVVFTFIFVNFPSGLVLYWMVSNLVSITQQYFTQKKLA